MKERKIYTQVWQETQSERDLLEELNKRILEKRNIFVIQQDTQYLMINFIHNIQ